MVFLIWLEVDIGVPAMICWKRSTGWSPKCICLDIFMSNAAIGTRHLGEDSGGPRMDFGLVYRRGSSMVNKMRSPYPYGNNSTVLINIDLYIYIPLYRYYESMEKTTLFWILNHWTAKRISQMFLLSTRGAFYDWMLPFPATMASLAGDDGMLGWAEGWNTEQTLPSVALALPSFTKTWFMAVFCFFWDLLQVSYKSTIVISSIWWTFFFSTIFTFSMQNTHTQHVIANPKKTPSSNGRSHKSTKHQCTRCVLSPW